MCQTLRLGPFESHRRGSLDLRKVFRNDHSGGLRQNSGRAFVFPGSFFLKYQSLKGNLIPYLPVPVC
eukprot:COSAG03_NODE_1061_length_4928_cov_1084.029613_2_plen_67_part_00